MRTESNTKLINFILQNYPINNDQLSTVFLILPTLIKLFCFNLNYKLLINLQKNTRAVHPLLLRVFFCTNLKEISKLHDEISDSSQL